MTAAWRLPMAGIVLGTVVALSGCGGTSSGATGSSGATPADVSAIQASARAQASAIASAVGGSTVDPLAGQREGGDNPVSSAEFCALIKKEVAKVDGQSKIQAMTSIVSDIADLYAAKKAMAKMDGSKMDDLAKSCPGDAAKVLKAAGATSFSQL